MVTEVFRGFAGTRLDAEVTGSPDDPVVLLVHGAGQTREAWNGVGTALVAAGRRVVNLNLRGHGTSEWPADGRYDFDAYVDDLRAVLGQLGSRPVVVAASLGAWAAVAALNAEAGQLAAGLVLVDLPTEADPAVARGIGERLKRRAQATTANWDHRIIGAIDVASVPQRLADAAPQINLPVMFIRGELSPLDTTDAAMSFVGLLPDAEFAAVEAVGLVLTESRTEAFDALLLDFLERRAPRSTPEFRAGSDARTLRDALGCFATGVTIVTAVDGNGRPTGLTANSFTSVSLEPPLLLVCIAKNAGSAAALSEAEHFVVNVLQIGQQPTSNRFAGKREDRFGVTDWEPGETGAPILAGSLSSFECARHAVHDGGDHLILVGRVVCARFEPRRDPLLYFRGRYRRLHFT